MKRTIIRLGMSVLIINLLFTLFGPDLAAQISETHPRIWLTPATVDELVERYNRNTYNAGRLRAWCDTNINASLDGYVDSRGIGMLKATNYALMYQLTGNTAYSGRAVEIIEYGFDHPYTNRTVDDWPGFDNFYTDRYLVPATAFVLDWCYDAMSETQRNRLIDQLDYWAGYIIDSTPWAWRDASNNYYYGHAWAILTAGYAIHGHRSTAAGYIAEAKMMLGEGIKYTNGEDVPWPISDNYTGRASGGMWNEGTSYGSVNHDFIFSMVLAIRKAEDAGAYPEFDFPGDVIKFHIYSTHPDGRTLISEGDGAGTMTIDDKIRVPVVLATALASGDEKGFGQYWLNNYSSNTTSDYKLYNEFIWYDDQQENIDYRSVLPDMYHSDGSQILVWREGWGESDCWISLRIGLLNTDHAHNGLGNFVIYDDGHLAPDKASALNQNMAYHDYHHNVLSIALPEDRKLYWGASSIEHISNNPDYLYYAGDMSGPYLAQPEYRNNTVAHKEREFLLLKKEKTLVVMDRGTTFSSSTEKTFQVYLINPPTMSGSDYRTSNGSQDLLVHTAWPPDATFSTTTDGLPLLQVRDPEVTTTNTFLHLFKVTTPGGTMNSSPVASNTPSVVASAFQSSVDPVDYLVSFSSDAEGDVIEDESFTLTYNRYSGAARIYLMNMAPNTPYYMYSTADGGTAMVTVSTIPLGQGFQITSDGDGVIFAAVNLGEDPLPTPVPEGGTIDK